MTGPKRSCAGSFARTAEPCRAIAGSLLERYRYVHAARKVVGVGSVGTRAWIMLLLGRDDDDPLLLQVKEAEASVLEPYLGASTFANHGQRVVEGQRLMQAASDIMLGWLRVDDLDGVVRDFYVRQLWDAKGSALVEAMDPRAMRVYAELCGWTLARAHARSGDRVAIASYLGRSDIFDRALATFAEAYADQNERDYDALAGRRRRRDGSRQRQVCDHERGRCGRRGGRPGLLHRYLPILGWLPHYDRKWLAGDAVAGLSVWSLLVPQSLAYATLAGVPVQYGLYTAFVALLAYPIFGTSRQLVAGPERGGLRGLGRRDHPDRRRRGDSAPARRSATRPRSPWPPAPSTSRWACCAWDGSRPSCPRR